IPLLSFPRRRQVRLATPRRRPTHHAPAELVLELGVVSLTASNLSSYRGRVRRVPLRLLPRRTRHHGPWIDLLVPSSSSSSRTSSLPEFFVSRRRSTASLAVYSCHRYTSRVTWLVIMRQAQAGLNQGIPNILNL
uniref:Uncharacterized protein n=1 Tax=Triticum urartu TaxID=4572 RepID=A0A8R7V7J8_TRIUA